MGKKLSDAARSFLSCYYPLLSIACLCLLLVISACHSKPSGARILFTGDVLLARNVQAEIEQKKISPWIYMEKLFHSADLVIGNFEGAVGGEIVDTMPPSSSPVFNVPEAYIKLLSAAGFNALSVENNHSFDMGDRGKANTIEALQKNGLTPLGYNNSPWFFKVNGVTVSVVAVNLVPGRNGQRQEIPSVEIRQKLRLARSLSGMVVVYIHWGSELLQWPNQYQRDAAAFLVSNGADLIIGCHPHVIQEPEMVMGKPVFFSIGNHLFDQKYADTKAGLIVDCNICDGYFECSGIITHTAPNSFYPRVTGAKQYKFGKTKLQGAMKISGIAIEPLSLNTPGKMILKAVKNNKLLWQTYPMSIISLQHGKLDGKNDFLFALEKHYSNMDDEMGIRPYVYSIEQNGLVSRWRGSALAWPLIDAALLPGDTQILCGLHRGDSFIQLNRNSNQARVLAYKWNGFGFTGISDSATCQRCKELFNKQGRQN